MKSRRIIGLVTALLTSISVVSCGPSSPGNAPFEPSPSPSGRADLPDIATGSVFALLLAPTTDKLHLLDLADNRIKLSVDTGRKPVELAVSRNNSYLLVLNQLDGTVTAMFREDNLRIQNLGVAGSGLEPTDLTFNNAGTEAFVAYHGSGKIAVLDIPNRDRPDVKRSLLLQDQATGLSGKPYKLAVSTDDQTLYAVDKENSKLFTFRRQNENFARDKMIDLNNIRAEDMVFHNSRLYISDSFNNSIAVFNPENDQLTSISLMNNQVSGGLLPTRMEINQAENELYIINESVSTVAVVNLADNSLKTHIMLSRDSNDDSSSPTALSISPDGARIYVTNSAGRNLSIINTADDSLSRNIGTSSSSGTLVPLSDIEIL